MAPKRILQLPRRAGPNSNGSILRRGGETRSSRVPKETKVNSLIARSVTQWVQFRKAEDSAGADIVIGFSDANVPTMPAHVWKQEAI